MSAQHVVKADSVAALLNAAPWIARVEHARRLLQRRMAQWQTHLPADPSAPGTRSVRTYTPTGLEGEADYNSEVAIYREGIALMAELLLILDPQDKAHG